MDGTTEVITYFADSNDLGVDGNGLVEVDAVDPMEIVVCDYINTNAANLTINKDSGMYSESFTWNVTPEIEMMGTLSNTTSNAGHPMIFNGTTDTNKIQAGIDFNVTENLPVDGR